MVFDGTSSADVTVYHDPYQLFCTLDLDTYDASCLAP
jgi:hypothetical protein